MDLLIIVIITVVVETKKCMQVLEEVTSTKVSTKATKKKLLASQLVPFHHCLLCSTSIKPQKKYLWDLGNGTGRRRRRLQGAVIFPFTVNSSVMRSSLNWRGVGCYDF